MALPLITIGITAFNAQDTISQAAQSALDQSWPNTEIIIVDDSSTDNTPEIINKFKNLHDKIHAIYNTQNQGVASARNQIIAAAKGEFLAFFDDDDESFKNRLQKQFEALVNAEKNNPDCPLILCHAGRLQIYPDGARHYEAAPGTNQSLPLPKGHDMAARILWGQPIVNGFGSMATCAQMARLRTYRELGGFDPGFSRCEDTDLAIRLALQGGGFVGTSEPLLQQRMTYGSEKSLDHEFKFIKQLYEKQKIFIDSQFSYGFCLSWLDVKFLYLRGKKFHFFMKIVGLAARHPFLCLRKILWALPNYKFNRQAIRYHKMNPILSESRDPRSGQNA